MWFVCGTGGAQNKSESKFCPCCLEDLAARPFLGQAGQETELSAVSFRVFLTVTIFLLGPAHVYFFLWESAHKHEQNPFWLFKTVSCTPALYLSTGDFKNMYKTNHRTNKMQNSMTCKKLFRPSRTALFYRETNTKHTLVKLQHGNMSIYHNKASHRIFFLPRYMKAMFMV